MISQAPGALCSQYEVWLCNLENGRLEHLFEIIAILPLVYNNVQSSLLTTLFFVFRSGFSESILPFLKSSWSCLNWPEWVVYGYSLELSLSRSTSSQLVREHVTNIDGEVESWRPATNNQIWKGGSMHMKADICRVR